jgi:hypothetical protein
MRPNPLKPSRRFLLKFANVSANQMFGAVLGTNSFRKFGQFILKKALHCCETRIAGPLGPFGINTDIKLCEIACERLDLLVRSENH